MTGSTTLFRVLYLVDDDVVAGHGVLSVAAPYSLQQSWVQGSERKEYVALWPSSAGTFTASLSLNGQALPDWTVTALRKDDLASVEIVGTERETWALDGQPITLLAIGRDRDGGAVLGSRFVWDRPNGPLRPTGDVLEYTYDRHADPLPLGLRVGELEHHVELRGDSFDVQDSSRPPGCATAPGPLRALLALAVAALVRRRKTCADR